MGRIWLAIALARLNIFLLSVKFSLFNTNYIVFNNSFIIKFHKNHSDQRFLSQITMKNHVITVLKIPPISPSPTGISHVWDLRGVLYLVLYVFILVA